MVRKGTAIAQIKEVCSHPMALLQCKEYFKAHPHIKLVEDVDTAETAKRIMEKKLAHTAAIAPKVAADLYGLDIVAENIQTIKNNATRFIIVKTKTKALPKKDINKAPSVLSRIINAVVWPQCLT